MKKGKILIFIAIIALAIILNIKDYLDDNHNIFDYKKYKFDSFAISKLKEQEFHRLRITKDIGRKSYTRWGYDDKINEILEYLNSFELEVYDEWTPRGDISYYIRLYNSNTYETVSIDVLDEKIIRVSIKNIIKKENKKDKITNFDEKYTRKTFTVVNEEIDLNYIEEIFISLEEEKR